MDISLTEDEIVTIYNYFDNKQKGKITKKRWLSKFEVVDFLDIGRVNDKNQQEILSDKISQRQKVLGVIQKIYLYC